MKHSDAETILDKALYISFVAGQHPDSEGKDLPGTINLAFNNEEIYDAVDLYKYLIEQFGEFDKEIKVTNVQDPIVDVEIIIYSSPYTIFHIKNIRRSTIEYNLEWFRKKEAGRNIYLCFKHNQQTTSLDGTAIFMEIGSKLNQMTPILIHSWNG